MAARTASTGDVTGDTCSTAKSRHQGLLLTDPAMTGREFAESLTGKTFIFGLVGPFANGNAEIWPTDFRTRIEA
jgi:hypothetical protein